MERVHNSRTRPHLKDDAFGTRSERVPVIGRVRDASIFNSVLSSSRVAHTLNDYDDIIMIINDCLID